MYPRKIILKYLTLKHFFLKKSLYYCVNTSPGPRADKANFQRSVHGLAFKDQRWLCISQNHTVMSRSRPGILARGVCAVYSLILVFLSFTHHDHDKVPVISNLIGAKAE